VSFRNHNFWTITLLLIYNYLGGCLVYICYILRVYGQTKISVLCFKYDFVCNCVICPAQCHDDTVITTVYVSHYFSYLRKITLLLTYELRHIFWYFLYTTSLKFSCTRKPAYNKQSQHSYCYIMVTQTQSFVESNPYLSTIVSCTSVM